MVSKYKKVVAELDVAAELAQRAGWLDIAKEIDKVSNTLDNRFNAETVETQQTPPKPWMEVYQPADVVVEMGEMGDVAKKQIKEEFSAPELLESTWGVTPEMKYQLNRDKKISRKVIRRTK